MENMIERIARAIEADVQRLVYKQKYLMVDDLKVIAAIAVKTMREPTEAMVSAGEAEVFEDRDVPTDVSLQLTNFSWKAMIDAALKEKA